ncbi:MAG: hypothetical protein AB1564_10040 [Chloroflexota bacterium]
MSKRKKIVLRLALTLAIFVSVIAALEILSRTHNCSSSIVAVPTLAAACSNPLYTEDVSYTNYLNELSERYRLGVSPSREDLDKAVIEVDRDVIGGANGRYCGGVAFVSDDLPTQAELYVRRHELEHVFQHILRMEEENREAAANYAAAKEYPVGMVETVVFTIVESRKYFNSTACHIIALWITFKVYFLPFMV